MLKKLLPILLLLLSTQTVCGQLLCRFTVSDTGGCSPLIIHFTDSSTGNPTSWHWNFGNGDTSNLQTPVDSFIDSGTYHILLRISDGTSVDSQYLSIYVFPKPLLDFIPNSTFAQCPPFPVQFTNTSGADSLSAKWYFGDGDSSILLNPYHIYRLPERYSVTLTGKNSYGCHATVTHQNLIQVKGPIGHFTDSIVRDSCTALTVIFSGTETSVASSILDMGDGSSYYDTSYLSYNYTTAGTFYPVFTLTDSFGCKVAYNVNPGIIKVFGLASLSENSVADSCSFETDRFTGTAVAATSCVFATGDGAHFYDTTNITYTYTSPGTYQPVFILTDSFGCTASYPGYKIVVPGCHTTAIEMIEPNQVAFNASPNPCPDYLKITCTASETYKISLTDATGREWIADNMTANKAINTASLANGIYFLSIQSLEGKQFTVKKLLIQH